MRAPLKVFASRETTAFSVGIREVVVTLESEAAALGRPLIVAWQSSPGLFYLEPMLLIGEERLAFGPLTEADVPALLSLAPDQLQGHPKCLGPLAEIDYLAKQSRKVFAGFGEGAAKPFFAWETAKAMTPEALVAEVKASGLRGRGGAGFPTHIKMETVRVTGSEEKFVVCNADEGDAGTFSDRMMMEGAPLRLIEGMMIAARAVGGTQGYLYLRSEYPLAAEILREALASSEVRARLEEVAPGFDIHLRLGAGSYVCGEETALLESLEGRRGEVRAKPPLPAHAGLFGQPTLVNNVITLASLPLIVEGGGAGFAADGTATSKGTLPVQLSGNVKRGGLVEVPFGTSLRDLVYDFGGGTLSGRPVKAVQIGGPLGGYLPEAMLDLPLDIEAVAAAGASVGHGGIIVFDDRVSMGRLARFAFEFCAAESCGKCTPCRIGSVRGVEVMDRILAGEGHAANLALLDDLCDTLTEGSLCAMGGLTPQPVRSALKYFPEDFS